MGFRFSTDAWSLECFQVTGYSLDGYSSFGAAFVWKDLKDLFSPSVLLLFCSFGGWGGVVCFFFLFRMSSSKPEMQRLDCEEDHSERTGRCME